MFERRAASPLAAVAPTTTSTRRTAASAALFPITPRPAAGGRPRARTCSAGDVVPPTGAASSSTPSREFEHGDTRRRLLDSALLRRLHHGRGHHQRRAALQAPLATSAPIRARAWPRFDADAWEAAIGGVRRPRPRAHLRRDDQRFGDMPSHDELTEILERMGKYRAEDELNCGACGYDTCRDHADRHLAGLAESRDVPAAHHRAAAQGGRRAGGVPPLARDAPRRRWSEREAGQHGPARGRHRPRGQQPAGHPAAARQPAARGVRGRLRACADDLETIVDQANRCKRIISGLLNFARQSRVVRQPTDVAELVDKVLRTRPRRRGRRRSRSTTRLADPIAEIDADQIVQVLTNLFTNAQHAMPDGGTITITLDGTEENVIIRVADTGTGIPKENMDKLFDPFFTTKQVRQGHRPRPGRHPRHRQDAPRPDHRGVQRRPGRPARPAPPSPSRCRGTRPRPASRPACRRSPGAER